MGDACSGATPQTKGTTKGAVSGSLEEKTGAIKDKGKKAVTQIPASDELKAVFTSFASFGQAAGSKRMNQSNWKKFCEDADLIDQKFPASDVALVFAASKSKGKNDISYKEFRNALGRVADKKRSKSGRHRCCGQWCSSKNGRYHSS